jgi:3-hydroxy-9,10-secoandrosta-1,3,5(10)-triene-9,17-dione monooxygenase reductase component
MTSDDIDPRAFRDALGTFATGVTVVTTRLPDGLCTGLTVSSFNSVSLRPPLIVWSLSLNSPSVAAFRDCAYYAVNVLAEDQVELSRRFALPKIAKFADQPFTLGPHGSPLLPDCCAHFECRNELRHDGGDHIMLIGRVESFERSDRPPLIFHGGMYRALKDLPLSFEAAAVDEE